VQGQFLRFAVLLLFGSTYADLATVLDVVRPALSKHEIAIIQDAAFIAEAGGNPGVLVSCRLAHSSGEWIESSLMLAVDDSKGPNANQKIGIAISYGRRYLLSAMVGIAQTDPDGAGSEGKLTDTPGQKPTQTRSQAPQSTKSNSMEVCPSCGVQAIITDKFKGGVFVLA